ncbi:MAG: fibronectin type III domain-containing protein [bacterium]|nr:fibronectin type III domain-containing protein [bacterium]
MRKALTLVVGVTLFLGLAHTALAVGGLRVDRQYMTEGNCPEGRIWESQDTVKKSGCSVIYLSRANGTHSVYVTPNTAASVGECSYLSGTPCEPDNFRAVTCNDSNCTKNVSVESGKIKRVIFKYADPVTPPPPPSPVTLSIPANLSASGQCAGNNESKVDVSWSVVTGATRYELHRKPDDSVTPYAEVSRPTATSFSDRGVVNGSSHRYKVRACNSNGCGQFQSNFALGITPANCSGGQQPPPPSGTVPTTYNGPFAQGDFITTVYGFNTRRSPGIGDNIIRLSNANRPARLVSLHHTYLDGYWWWEVREWGKNENYWLAEVDGSFIKTDTPNCSTFGASTDLWDSTDGGWYLDEPNLSCSSCFYWTESGGYAINNTVRGPCECSPNSNFCEEQEIKRQCPNPLTQPAYISGVGGWYNSACGCNEFNPDGSVITSPVGPWTRPSCDCHPEPNKCVDGGPPGQQPPPPPSPSTVNPPPSGGNVGACGYGTCSQSQAGNAECANGSTFKTCVAFDQNFDGVLEWCWSPPISCPAGGSCNGSVGSAASAGQLCSGGGALPPPQGPTPPPPPPAGQIGIGSCVRVNTNAATSLNVRGTANGNRIGSQLHNTEGTVTDGPQTTGGHVWREVDFNSGPDGWVASSFLVSCGGATPPPPPPVEEEFFLGAYVTPTTGGSGLTVRNAPDGNAVGTQVDGIRGVIHAGPANGAAFDWYFVDFETGTDGYVAEEFIKLMPEENKWLLRQRPNWIAIDSRLLLRQQEYASENKKPGYEAEFISINLPTSVGADEVFTGTVTFKNIGTESWDHDDLNPVTVDTPPFIDLEANWMHYINDGQFDRPQLPVKLPKTVAPGEEITIPLNLRAPVDGEYNFAVRMKWGFYDWFGPESDMVKIRVGNPNLVREDCSGYPSTRIISWATGWKAGYFGEWITGFAREYLEIGEKHTWCADAREEIYRPVFPQESICAPSDFRCNTLNPVPGSRSGFGFQTRTDVGGVGHPQSSRYMTVIPPPGSGLQIESCLGHFPGCLIEEWQGVGDERYSQARPGIYIAEVTGLTAPEPKSEYYYNYMIACPACGGTRFYNASQQGDVPRITVGVSKMNETPLSGGGFTPRNNKLTINRGESVRVGWTAQAPERLKFCTLTEGTSQWAVYQKNGSGQYGDYGPNGELVVTPSRNSVYVVLCEWRPSSLPDSETTSSATHVFVDVIDPAGHVSAPRTVNTANILDGLRSSLEDLRNLLDTN